MNSRNLRALFLIWLGLSLVPATGVISFDLSALSPGNNGVFPFTYIGAAASLIGVSVGIFYRENKKLWAIPLAIIASNASSIGMINVYEQVFVSLNQITYQYSYWFFIYWSNEETATWTVIGMLWILASAPWWNAKNLRFVVSTLIVFGVSMGTWFLFGMPTSDSGSPLALALNAITRITSQAVLIFLCLPWKLKIRKQEVRDGVNPRPLLPLKGSEQGNDPVNYLQRDSGDRYWKG
jgi:hypothetical protein